MTSSAAFLFAGLLAASSSLLAADPAHWDYTGEHGPGHWAELGPDFTSCKLGKQQSPIDIRHPKHAKLTPIGFHYESSAAEIVNTGHTVQVNLAQGGAATLQSGDYRLLQFHFHTPSEERINGKQYPLVAHLVHKNDAGELAVVALLFKEGHENAALKAAFDELPAGAGEQHALSAPVDIAALLPKHHDYYAYTGSLTTPPCSENVHWQVMREAGEVSAAQLAAFRKLYPMNARPVQPLHGRVVKVGG